MASNSAAEALRPFIFQLPAISGRMASVMSISHECLVKHALAEPARQFQIPRFSIPEAVNRFHWPARGKVATRAAATL